MPEPTEPPDLSRQTRHASCVELSGRAALIIGASGSGKSALALGLMSRGATLVADDRTLLEKTGRGLIASCPASIAGLIEARGVGLLNAAHSGPTQVCLVVDLDKTETDRLPPLRNVTIQEVTLPLIHKVESSHFVDSVLQYLKSGRSF